MILQEIQVLRSIYASQTLGGPVTAHNALTGAKQVIPRGPFGFQETIKQLGTNGGGPLNANGADPFEDPTALTHFLSFFLLLSIPVALTYTFGKMVGSVRQGVAILGVMAVLFGGSLAVASVAGHQANPAVAAAGLTHQSAGNMEGKECPCAAGPWTSRRESSTSSPTWPATPARSAPGG